MTHAIPPCPPRESLVGPSRKIIDDLIHVNVVDKPDRKTAEQYAKANGKTTEAIEHRYAATGDLICEHGNSQANVTLKRDIITTAAHAIYAGKAYGKDANLSGCKFITKIDGQEEIYEIDSIVGTGLKEKGDLEKGGHDWAVLKLKKSVSNKIKPYRVDPTFENDLEPGSEFVAVGKSNDFPSAAKGFKGNPRHYGDCAATRFFSNTGSPEIGTNCDMSPGDSGGALLRKGDPPGLIGVHLGGLWSKTCRPDPKKTSGPSTDCWNTGSTAITDKFLEALQEGAASSRSTD